MARPRKEGTWLKQRENGVYYAFWYDPEKRRTRQFSLGTKDGHLARLAHARFTLGGEKIYKPEPEEGPTVEACLDRYLEEHAEKNCAAPQRQRQAATHLRMFFADTLMADVDIPMSRKYAAARLSGEIGVGSKRGRGEKAGAPATVRRELNTLVAAANHARVWKRLTVDQMPSVELPEPGTSETPWYTKRELAKLFEASEGYLNMFIRIAYYTGARRASIEFLHKSQIDLVRNTINLSKAGERVTVKRRPIVPIYEEIHDDLMWLTAKSGENKGALFPRTNLYRPYRELCQKIGLAHKANPHILRHSRATHLLQAGVSIYDVAKLLGDTIRTVETTYAHACSEHLADNTRGK